MAGCKACGPAVEVEAIRVLRFRNWPDQWVQQALPNDLMLLDGPVGSCGGILKLRIPDAFMVLSAAQVWRGEPAVWPVADGIITKFRIVGQEIRYVLRH
jgi:hypothetical protein